MSHIRIDNLYKAYSNRRHSGRPNDDHETEDIIQAIDGVSLEFSEGELVCILGPSGCGKSSLLRIVAGFDDPTTGSVLIDNYPVDGPSSDNIFVFQHSGLLPWMTVWENVELGLRHLDNQTEKEEKIQEYIDIVELSGFEHHYPHQLSGGMQRRAELSRALAVNPEMLIMDEPFNGLDFFTHMKMREEVVNMHQFIGKTVLIVTHSIDDALVMGDHIIVMSERPSRVKLDVKIDIPHPRDLSRNEELIKLRDDIYLMLGVSYVA